MDVELEHPEPEPPFAARDLLFVLRLACTSNDQPVDLATVEDAAARAIDELPGRPEDQLHPRIVRAGCTLGVATSEVRATWREAAAAVSLRCPLFLLTADGPIALVERRGRRARLLGADGADRWVSDEEPADGRPTATVRTWLALDSALPAASDHGEHGHHLTPLQRLQELLLKEREDLFVLIAYAALVALLSLAIPVATQVLVNTVAFGVLLQPIAVLSILLLAALGSTAIINVLSFVVVEHLQRRIFVRVTADLVHRLPRIRIDAFDDVDGPELVNRFFDVLTVQKALSALLLDGIALVLSAVVGLSLLAVYHPLFLGFNLLLVALVVLVLYVFGRGAVRTAIDESKAKYAVASWIEELARHPLAFKSAPDLASRRGDALAHGWLRTRQDHFGRLLGQIAGLHGLHALITGLLFALGGWLVIRGQLTLGQLVAAELVVATVLGTVRKFGKQLDAFYDLLAALDKLGHLVDLPLERSDGDLPVERRQAIALDLDGVEGLGVAGVDLKVAAGERIVLAGDSGSGKTLLLHLLAGLRQPAAGRLLWNGVDLRDLRLDAIRRDLAFVSGVEVVNGTVTENVAMGRASVRSVDVRSALASVGLLDDIARLPDGLQTALHAGGLPLTRGQQARLMVARALAGRPRLLLVDDVLDSLAPHDLDCLIAALFAEDRSATVLVASRHPQILARADRIHTLTRSPTAPPPAGAQVHA